MSKHYSAKQRTIRLKIVFSLACLVILLGGIVFVLKNERKQGQLFPLIKTPTQLAKEYTAVDSTPAPTASPLPTPTPTPKPLTFAEMNTLHGPCAVVPTLMYHHTEDLGIAKTEGHAQLTVDTKNFRADMQYLKDKGYSVLPMTSLIAFFDNGTPLPKKPVILTFDDGYQDFATDAAPILREFNFPGTMFVPTGLLQNPGYMSWSTVIDLASSGQILMSNHTWSHHNMGTSKAVIEKEITTADKQLGERNLNTPKVFAYPYGTTSAYAARFLQQMGYKLAFTTIHGSTLCKQQRLVLPRIRIGNASLSSYGL